MITVTRGLLTFVLVVGGALTVDAEEPQRPDRYIYNSDADNMFIYKGPPMQPEDVYPYIDQVAAAGVTTFSMSPNDGMVMNFPSRHARMLGDEEDPETLKQIEEAGKNKPGTLARAALNYGAFVEQGTDAMAIAVGRAKEQGMEVFLSFRMNEVHGTDTPDTFPYNLILSRFWREHPEYWIGHPGDELSQLHQDILGPRTSPVVGKWLPGGLDFAHDDVRQRRFDQIKECLDRYDVDGLEMDFQRFPIYFKYGEEEQNLDVMTEFIRSLRELSQQIGDKRGRPMLLSARVMARPDQNRALGLDVFRWADEGLVDFLIASHYLRNDFPLPVQEYRERMPKEMPLYASIEVEPKADTYRTFARQLYAEGVDGLMLFNYFTRRESGNEPDFSLVKELSDPKTIAEPANAAGE
ncbi:MAG: hypothetical protein KDA93_13295 [Planctomycetaceae bacterium]|nr:hypothetical protein [Planctomycetaceae bacterium]